MITPAAHNVLGIVNRQGQQIGTDPDTGAAIYEQIPRAGWHVNAAWPVGAELPPAWAATRIEPLTPSRRTSGLPDALYFETFHRFDSEAAFLIAAEAVGLLIGAAAT